MVGDVRQLCAQQAGVQIAQARPLIRIEAEEQQQHGPCGEAAQAAPGGGGRHVLEEHRGYVRHALRVADALAAQARLGARLRHDLGREHLWRRGREAAGGRGGWQA